MAGCHALSGGPAPTVDLPCERGCSVAETCGGRGKGTSELCRLEKPSENTSRGVMLTKDGEERSYHLDFG
ncbi:hypothetical protein COT78_04155 [Candidatus Berkelbacteria bacterium CG10_big_fil_rev_8_21_14_0_10_43_13]|uniref:Uncharacterized protein n=1 Tax=Candidatus Berkelbacteria bacterium CG10_big_fil_rev_8_21_14_0_10_43_13 TaxID=1974514 RepID=A0A2H0W5H1_9BACT|nr:MAG: hypothetical protein COT78_04155 [Candidatus Berkelbacteria bacterium CG10_big_fil_rev_8_21_14_0_10_43_13]